MTETSCTHRLKESGPCLTLLSNEQLLENPQNPKLKGRCKASKRVVDYFEVLVEEIPCSETQNRPQVRSIGSNILLMVLSRYGLCSYLKGARQVS